MNLMYVFALIIPLSLVGAILVYSADKMINNYYFELLELDNSRVKDAFSQIATQTYNISNEICFDNNQKKLLTNEYNTPYDFVRSINENTSMDTLIYNNDYISSIEIYCDNPGIENYKQYKRIDKTVKESEWYIKASEKANAFWISVEGVNTYGNKEVSLCMVRRMFLTGSEYEAVIVIKVSNDYIHSRIESKAVDAVALNDDVIVYGSKSNWIGKKLPVDINYKDIYFTYSGVAEVDENEYFMALSTANLYMTDSKLYVSTLNDMIYDDVKNIKNILTVMMVISVFVPGIILIAFSYKFTGRVYLLREEMHKASNKEYNMRDDFPGNDELSEAFDDLKKMVSDIKEKEAQMYKAQIKEKELINNQQIMEYKMLASQINPHYLYNTLETIRMKSLTMGNKEVADCIKILGKTLQYVLKNTGTTSTTLQKEIEHVKNYLAIQKIRFGNRINYEFEMEEGLEPEKYVVLPLILQPIVENAVVHGIENINGEGFITVKILHNDFQELQISVSDNGQGMKPEEYEQVRTKLNTPGLKLESSIGVYNICERIRLHYGEEYGLQIESEYGKGTKVVLYLPVINAV